MKAYPTQLNEAMAAYKHLLEVEKVPRNSIIFIGDSGGGNLVAAMLLYLRDHSEIPRPAGSILISAWLDMSHSRTVHSPYAYSDFVYVDGTPAMNLDISRTFAGTEYSISDPCISMALSTNLKGVPSHLCAYGGAEVFREDNTMWIKQCRKDGVDVVEYMGKGGIHTFSLGGLAADGALERESDQVLFNYMLKCITSQ